MSLTEKKYLGIVSLVDIAVYISYASYFHSQGNLNVSEEEFSKMTSLQKSIGDVLSMTAESSKAHVLSEEAKIHDILEVFSWGVHRVLVVTHDGETQRVKILTQTDICKLLREHEANLAGIMHHTLASLNVGDKSAVRASAALTALEAYRLLSQRGVSALPIVDPFSGELLGTLSAADLRGLSEETLPKLLLPVLQYIRFARGIAPEAALPVVSCSPLASLQDALHMMLNNHVHRVWIVDHSKLHDTSVENRLEGNEERWEDIERKRTPRDGPRIGVVSLTDVIYQFSPWHNWSR
jgi:CBS domain-containing protein